ncbi:MAG: FtsQ-type POTRA domain-containing protein [Actinomycetota bacterium]
MAPVVSDPYETSDVRIVRATPANDSVEGGPDEPGSVSLLAELSQAFADDEFDDVRGDRRADDLEDGADDDDAAEAETGTGTNPTVADRSAAVATRTTIAIGGDDVPDIAYLDDALGSDDDSGTVFIDDDGRSDAMQPSAAGAPTVDARMRQRRIGVRRAANRRRLYWIGAITAVLAVVIGALAVLGSGWFSVGEVTVIGLRYADADGVDEVVADLEGTPVLLVDTADLEARLEALPWVEVARVTTDFPDEATIELREREPVATTAGTDGRFRILDREGRVLDVIDGQAAALVLLTGPDPVDLQPGQFTEVGHAAAAALVTKLTPEVRGRLVSISTNSDGSDMGLVLRSADGAGPDIAVRLGQATGDNEQVEKLVRLERVLDDADGAGATQIDVSTSETTQR